MEENAEDGKYATSIQQGKACVQIKKKRKELKERSGIERIKVMKMLQLSRVGLAEKTDCEV